MKTGRRGCALARLAISLASTATVGSSCRRVRSSGRSRRHGRGRMDEGPLSRPERCTTGRSFVERLAKQVALEVLPA